jgi:ABC-type proline/glycine betaine transport system permease subunit
MGDQVGQLLLALVLVGAIVAAVLAIVFANCIAPAPDWARKILRRLDATWACPQEKA